MQNINVSSLMLFSTQSIDIQARTNFLSQAVQNIEPKQDENTSITKMHMTSVSGEVFHIKWSYLVDEDVKEKRTI